MKKVISIVFLISTTAIFAFPAMAQEEDPVTEYLSYFQQMGTSDSLLTQLEANVRLETRDSTWLAAHMEIQRKIMLEYRLNKLRELVQTGTDREKAAAEAKIQELLAEETTK